MLEQPNRVSTAEPKVAAITLWNRIRDIYRIIFLSVLVVGIIWFVVVRVLMNFLPAIQYLSRPDIILNLTEAIIYAVWGGYLIKHSDMGMYPRFPLQARIFCATWIIIDIIEITLLGRNANTTIIPIIFYIVSLIFLPSSETKASQA